MKRFYNLLLSGLLLCLAAGLSAQPLSVTVSDANGSLGQQVCVDITGANFTAISGMQFSITYDPGVLEFVSAGGSMGGTNVLMIHRANNPGTIRAAWNLLTATGYTDPGPFNIGMVCFNILVEMETQVQITNTPIPTEFTDDQNMIIDGFSITNGTINLGLVVSPTCTDGIMNGNETGVDCGGPDCSTCPTCSDGIRNGNETGVDCGGPDCAACIPTCTDGIRNGNETGVDCGGPDCAVCPPTCSDGVQNGNETGVDCGGPDCAACPTCSDGIRNGRETGVDCGGPDCAACPPTCTDGVRNGNETGVDCGGPDCAACPTCSDGIRNGRETGVDCGGPDCAACPPTCTDRIRNGNETGVDCGGPDCSPCPTCSDGIQNGNETGIDCGGSCGPCNPDDCGAGSASFNLCIESLCDIAVGAQACVELTVANFTNVTAMSVNLLYPGANLEYQNATQNSALNSELQINEFSDGEVRLIYFQSSQSGLTLDDNETMATVCFTNETGGTTGLTGSNLRVSSTSGVVSNTILNDGSINDCMTSMPTCTDGIQNGTETGIDCGGSCTPCMTAPTCTDGIQNGTETGIDCGGSCTPCSGTGGGPDTDCGNGTSNLTLCLGDACSIPQNGQACIDITTGNFTNVTAFSADVVFEAGQLFFQSVSTAVPLGDNIQVNVINTTTIRLLYFQSAQSGVSVGNGTTIGTLCFTNQTTNATNLNFNNIQVNSTTGPVLGPVGNGGSVNDCTGTTPTCSDGIQNGTETGVDCGGTCAPCMTMPTCNDGIQNGTETGIDCGGNCVPCNGTGGGPNTDCGNGTSDLTLCLGEVCSIPQNGQACLDITAGNFANITAFSTDITFQAGQLSYQSVNTVAALGDDVQVNVINASTVRLLYFQSAQSGVSVDNGTTIGTLCFTNQTTSATNLNFNNIQVNSTTGPVLGPVGNGGSVNDCTGTTPTCSDGIQNGNETGVDCGGSCGPCVTTCGEGTTDVQICVGSECADAGAEVCLPVYVGNFSSLGGFQMVLGYSTTNLTFTRIITPSALEDGFPDPGTATPGELRVVWNDVSGGGVTFDAETPAFELCFTANNTVATPITFVDPSSRLRAFNEQGQSLAVTGSAGAVNVNCSSMPTCSDGIQNGSETGVDCGGPDCAACLPTCTDGVQNGNETGVDCGGPDCAPCSTGGGPDLNCGMGTSSASMCLGDACGIASGATACVDITVGNFTSITAFAASINFPPGALTFTSISSDAGLEQNMQANMFSSGEVRIIYLQSAQTGVSYDNGDVIGSICFTNNTAGETVLDLNNLQIGSTSGPLPNPVASDGSVNGCVTTMPTCTDGIQNGNETGVDCGGPDCSDCPTASTVDFSVDNGMAAIGQQVCVDVKVSDFNDITNLALTLNFNPAVLQLSSVTANSALPGFAAGNFNTLTPGQIGVTYSSTTPRSLADDEPLFTVCWTVLTGDQTTVNVTNASATNGAGTNLTVNTSSGTINTGGVVTYENFTIVAGSGTGTTGQEVCIDFPVFNLEGLAGLQFGFTYDATRLQFNNATATGALQGLQVANPEPGIIRVIWFDPNVGSNSIPDGESILSACFNVLQDCETPIEITDLPQFNIRATNANNQPVTPIDVVDGTINAGVAGCNNPPRNLIMDLTNDNGGVGEEVCVDLIVTDFTSLSDLSFTIDYDESILSFNGASNFGLGSVTTANVSNPIPGSITFDWDAAGSGGQSLANGSTLLSLCFTVDRLVANNINFANSPVLIQARNAAGQNVGVVPSGGTINAGAPTVDGLTFQIGSAQAEIGETVCLPIVGFEVVDLIAFQYTVNYDPAILEYIGTGDDFAFRGALSVNNSLPGVLRIVWADAQARGNSIDDGSKIYSLCFRVITNDLAIVSFGGSPTAIEFEDVNSIVSADLINGQVNGSEAPAIDNAAQVNPSCSELSNGSIRLTVSGGGNLTYTWSPNVSSTANATGLAAGNYSVTVTNPGTGQSTSDSYTLVAPAPFSVMVDNVTGVSCNGEADGSIRIATVGGTPNYTIDWEGSLPDNVLSQTGLDGGSYSVTVSDANNCIREVMNIMVGEPAELLVGGTPISITEDPGGVNVVIQGGRAPFDYAWTGPENYTSNVEDINNVVNPGTYCLTVTDNNDCSKVQCFAIQRALTIVPGTGIIVSAGCFGEDNGSIDLTVSGGDGNYNYLWRFEGATFANTQDIDNLAPGDYTVMITSGTEEISSTISVEAPTQIMPSGTVSPATTGDNGSISLSPSGGNAPYSFAWADGPTMQNRTGLAAGQYCVTITDDSDCGIDRCYTVGTSAISFVSTSTRPTSCSGAEDGILRLVINNGTAPFNVRVEPIGIVDGFDDTTIEILVPAGTYQVFVTDDQGGEIDAELTVTEPEPVTAPGAITSDTEDTNCSGMISLNIAGGTAPYTVAWSNMSTGATISQLCEGDYTATVTDANGCTVTTETFTVGRLDETLDNVNDVACQDGTEGGVEVTISGGVTPYSFNWTLAGSTESLAVTEDISGVGSGEYTLAITDATGAMLIRNYTVGISAGFSVSASVTSSFSGFGVSCPDAMDGRIVAVISGQGEFTYEYLRDGQMIGIDSVLENAAAGTYTLTVMDDGGCEITRMIEVTAPTAITINPTVTNVSCGSEDDGSISAEIAGGVSPYRYLWSSGATSASIQGLGQGSYSLTVTDDNSCELVSTFTITAPEDLAITFEATDATDGCNGSVRILPLGGSGNYRFNWPQLPNQLNGPLAEGLCPGEYEIEVTDDNQCQTVRMVATVRDRRFPCLSAREVITPNGDGLNETFVIFCSEDADAADNDLEVYNRWGQLVYAVDDYNCSADETGTNCFEGLTNDGTLLPAGPYYYVFNFTNPIGERMQQRGSITIIRD